MFTLAKSECAILSKEEHDNSVLHPKKGSLFLRNVFLTQGKAAFKDFTGYMDSALIESDLNFFWDMESPSAFVYWNSDPWPGVAGTKRFMSLKDARKSGMEQHSIVEDPGFTDPAGGDLSVSTESQIRKLGIRILDTEHCGPRAPDKRMPELDVSCRPTGAVVFSD